MLWLLLSACALVQDSSMSTGEPGQAELHSLYPGLPPGAALSKAQDIGEALGWTACTRPEPGQLRCEDQGWRGEPDQVTITVEPYGPRFSRVSLRSEGRSWLGSTQRHAQRLRAFCAAYEAERGRVIP